MDLARLSREEAASLLLVDLRTLANYQKETPPIPVHGSGRKVAGKEVVYLVWAEVLDWWCNRKNREAYAKAVKTTDIPNEKLERALLIRAQRESKEIDTAQKQKEALSVSDFEQAMADMIAPARANLLAIEARLRPDLGNDAAAKVGAQIRLALRSLAEPQKEETP